MKEAIEKLSLLYSDLKTGDLNSIQKLAQSGGDRSYFRLTSNGQYYIGTFNENIRENETFIYFTEIFKKINAPVPEILSVSKGHDAYIQEDLGDESLLHVLERQGPTAQVFELFKQTLSKLAALQIGADRLIDYERCITSKEFGKQAILNDLLYFKYYFLDTLKIPYDKELLIADFEVLSHYLSHSHWKYFMYRDFQSRNVMVRNDKVFFIDYQGGMKGAIQYDVASLLWQAKANLSEAWKEQLLDHYISEVSNLLDKPVDRIAFIGQYNGYVLIRLLQVLGAYGFRGLFERKAHFLISIPQALKNLKCFLEQHQPGVSLPEFERIMRLMLEEEVISRFEPPRAGADTPLLVKISSFSYKKTGYPKDSTENGGGFVFDCRGIMNPGRIDQYKSLTGRDEEVKLYLEQQTRMPEFLMHVFNTVDIAVENYMERGFSDLAINFGCTGGQHRSVYAAEALARHLRNKYGVAMEISHIEQGIFEKKEIIYA